MNPGDESEDRAALKRALSRLLRPVARLMIRRALPLGEVVALLKEALVETAESEAALPGKRVTDSRISLLTGVHRKDVSALRKRGVAPLSSRTRSIPATVIGRWLGDPALHDAEGRPVPLYRKAADGAPSFEALVEGVSRDLRPRTVLDELVRVGALEDDPSDGRRLRLAVDALAPSGEELAALDFFGANLGDHAEAATRNLAAERGAPRFLERAVYYNRLPEEAVLRLEATARRDAMALLSRLNAEAFEAQKRARDDDAARERFRFGVYFFKETEDAASRDSDE